MPEWFEVEEELKSSRSWFCNGHEGTEGIHNFYYQLLLRLKGFSSGRWHYPHFPIENEQILERVYYATRSCLGCTGRMAEGTEIPELEEMKTCLKPLLEVEDERRRKPWLAELWEKLYGHWKIISTVICAVGLWPAVEKLARRFVRRTIGLDFTESSSDNINDAKHARSSSN
eukprot:CAMPEP_0114517480 /NCGR_PEP_ID=MMETSP0109-20121206/17916_1 /TAXON_ID=29199 /ORGANISM="Chlorarachnion reptans, Strain CCCM449" /LENGTH=171 /DNA_ID=CAMNT_0001698003 /DNA_START=1 /DNA_END=516 /DNA_ORIENTATION=-